MKSRFASFKFIFLPLLAGLSFQAHSALIGFDPSSSSVDIGETFDVDLTISGLDGFGPTSFISGFDLDVSFDDSLLAYGGFTFGTGLDLFGFGSIQDTFDLGGGLVNVFELSFDFDSDLEDFQPDDFVLGTFTFTGIASGTSALGAAAPFAAALSGGFEFDPILGFDIAVEVPLEVAAGSVSVPEPGVALLFATGLLGFGIQRKLKARA